MQLTFAPIARLSILVAASLLLAAAMIAIALNQAWLGLRLVPEPRLPIASLTFDGVWIDGVASPGPSAGISSFNALVAIGRPGEAPGLALEPLDLLEEPDVLGTYADMNAFFARQSAVSAIQNNPQIRLQTAFVGGSPVIHEIEPRRQRPLTNLPLPFWLQLAVGLVGFWTGAWIWTLQRGDWPARMLALAGGGLMISAFPAAIYSTRELAIDGTLFAWLSNANHAGAFIFGAGMIGLFLLYPRRLVSPAWLMLPVTVLAFCHAVNTMQWVDGPAIGLHLPVALAMATIWVLVAIQYVASRGNPRDRAALAWLGLSVAVGAGLFVVTVIGPNLLGLPPVISQGMAFLFFLLIYVGIALGVARYRLFQLDEWAFKVLYYVVGIVLLLLLDALLIVFVITDRIPAFALSLLLVAIFYLPLRDQLHRWMFRRREPSREKLFRDIVDVALTPPGADQRTRWEALLERSFRPLRIAPATGIAQAAIVEDGLVLSVPGPDPLPDYRLEYANGGRRLFSAQDVHLADEMFAMLANAMESRGAYEKGVAEERLRVARDIHDNIGVQLMGALHSKGSGRKDKLIRDTLIDLRDIINNASSPDAPLEEMLADMRAQVAEALFAAGIHLDWRSDVAGVTLPVRTAHAVRSLLRECVHNILKHSGAREVSVDIGRNDEGLRLLIRDDGRGFDPATCRQGNGLPNMQSRVAALGGTLTLDGDAPGTVVEALFPATRGEMA